MRACHLIKPYIPYDTDELISPFLGGASVEILCAASGMNVYASDLHEPLVHFWKMALENPREIAEIARLKYPPPLHRDDYHAMRKEYKEQKDDLMRAVQFYVLNRCSFGGMGELAGCMTDTPVYTLSLIKALETFECPRLHVECCDFMEALASRPTTFAYLDPPYYMDYQFYVEGNNMEFDHVGLYDMLSTRNSGWLMSYND